MHEDRGTSARRVVLSGIQPSGQLMLGNYLGALKSWVRLQAEYDCLFCLVDLHAITARQDPNDLRARTYECLAGYLACGIDPDHSIVFVQSQVPQHAELAWILNCFAYMGELSRMTQFKDKSAKQKNIGVGLFSYPVLMAADILLYQTHHVPVGEDQKQHLELCRDLALRINNACGPLFVVPEAFIPPIGARIMSLTDPASKMSKSDPDPNATVFLLDSDDAVRKKIRRAVTDSGNEIAFTDDKPGLRNLLSIQSAISGNPPDALVAAYAGKQYGQLKSDTAEIVVECLRPIREKAAALLEDRSRLDAILRRGADSARARAEPTLGRVKKALGFLG